MSDSPTEAFGPYLVYEQLGTGGMASVHRAELISAEGFHRPIALKRMLPHVAGNVEMVKAFVREAHLASQLRHANVAQTYELGRVGDTYFIAMELISGRNLRQVLRQCSRAISGPMPVPVALNIVSQICDALDYAHNLCDERGVPLGIIHRDVSPSNVLIAEGGVAKLIDFGIAKVAAASVQTMAGTIKGKFGYMAPEYIDGGIDARADLWAVGVIAHELLTNRPLFSTTDDLKTLRRVRDMTIDPPSTINRAIPGDVDHIVMTALTRDPAHRWQHATALRTAVTTVIARHHMVLTNAAMAEWIDWVFAQTPADHGDEDTDVDPSIVISTSSSAAHSNSLPEPPTIAIGPRPSLPARGTPGESPVAVPIVASTRTLAGTLPPRNAPRTASGNIAMPPPRPSDPSIAVAPLGHVHQPPQPGPAEVTRRSSAARTVVWLLVVAALAAAAVYFLLPLVT